MKKQSDKLSGRNTHITTDRQEAPLLFQLLTFLKNVPNLEKFQEVARVTGLEPATSGVTGRHSNQLSYTRALVE